MKPHHWVIGFRRFDGTVTRYHTAEGRVSQAHRSEDPKTRTKMSELHIPKPINASHGKLKRWARSGKPWFVCVCHMRNTL